MEANLYGTTQDASPDPSAYVAEWEKMPVADEDALSAWPSEYKPSDLGGGGNEWGEWKPDEGKGLWGAEDEDNSAVNKKPADAILCTVHGIICKKGICREYARILREKERAEKAEKDRAASGGSKGGFTSWPLGLDN
jgi:hypothetical protein